MSSLYDLLKRITRELPGCRLASVVNYETGMPLLALSVGDPIDTSGADAYHSDLYRVVAHALGELDYTQSPQGFVLTGREAIFVSLPLADTGFFWHIVTERATTIGFTQVVMRKHAANVQAGVQELLQAS